MANVSPSSATPWIFLPVLICLTPGLLLHPWSFTCSCVPPMRPPYWILLATITWWAVWSTLQLHAPTSLMQSAFSVSLSARPLQSIMLIFCESYATSGALPPVVSSTLASPLFSCRFTLMPPGRAVQMIVILLLATVCSLGTATDHLLSHSLSLCQH